GAAGKGAEQDTEEGDLTMGLSCANWLSHQLHISSSAAYAQVRLARALPAMPALAAAFESGQLSAQHATAAARSAEQAARGGGDTGEAEELLLREAGQREPRDLLRWGLGLVHRLAPAAMEAEEERLHRRRSLRLSEVFDGGCEIAGYLEPIVAAKLRT